MNLIVLAGGVRENTKPGPSTCPVLKTTVPERLAQVTVLIASVQTALVKYTCTGTGKARRIDSTPTHLPSPTQDHTFGLEIKYIGSSAIPSQLRVGSNGCL